jgi:hypothetical protein
VAAIFPSRICQGVGESLLFPPLDQALIHALACEVIAETEEPLNRQSLADLLRRSQKTLGKRISRSTVWRMLHDTAIKPWQHEHWLFPWGRSANRSRYRSSEADHRSGHASLRLVVARIFRDVSTFACSPDADGFENKRFVRVLIALGANGCTFTPSFPLGAQTSRGHWPGYAKTPPMC